MSALALSCLLVSNIATTSLFLLISRNNYPGGVAIHTLHQSEQDDGVHVHIDVFSAQTGVTRFTQLRHDWIYNKTENLPPGGPDMMAFSHLLVGAPVAGDKEKILQPYSTTHKTFAAIRAFDKVVVDIHAFPPFKFHFRNKCFVLKKITV